MSTTAEPAVETVQVYRVFIKATPEAVWQAIVDPAFTERYFYGTQIETTAERRVTTSSGMSGEDAVLEWDPPHRLVHGWHSKWNEELAAEAPSRVTWEIEQQEGGYTLLTLTHDQLEGAPKTARSVAGAGWMLVLSGLKTLLETGEPLA